jgi:catechol 2,3-dioxygenase-like lactoylglutathione lyase family enzyme
MALNCKVAFVTIGASNWEKSVEFYQLLLDQAPLMILPKAYAEFQLPGLHLGIYRPGPAAAGSTSRLSPADQGRLSLCLTVDSLEAALAHLAAIGHPVAGPIGMASHGREAFATDPDGNRLILYQPSARSGIQPDDSQVNWALDSGIGRDANYGHDQRL